MKYNIIMTRWKEYRTESGKSWSKIQHDKQVSTLSIDQFVRSFVNETWSGERKQWTYTQAGYYPYRITTPNPYAPERSVREFKFVEVEQ